MIHKLNNEAITEAKKLIQYSQNNSYALIMHCINGAELPFLAFKSINEYLTNNVYDEVLVFAMEKDFPIVKPNFAIFHSIDVNQYNGTVIATDIPTWQASLQSPSNNKFLYIYDVNRLNIPKELISKVNESEFKIFSRTNTHNSFLKNLGFKNIINSSMQIFSFEKLKEITDARR